MRFPNIPRGLVIFLSAIVVIVILIAGYEFLFAKSSTSPSGANSNSPFSSLFPFGGRSSGNVPSGNATTTPLTNESSGNVPLLRKVSAGAVSGGWFSKGAATTSAPTIRYMDRQTGRMTETPADSFAETRISNTTVPGVQELYAVTDSSLLVRLLDGAGNIVNAFGVVNATSSQQSFTTLPLKSFTGVAVAPGGASILTVTKTVSGSQITLSKPDGSKPQTLFNSPLASWVPLAGGTRTFLETAPSAIASGYLYELKGGVLQKIAGGLPGFAAIVSPSGRYVAHSNNAATGFAFSVLDTKSGKLFTNPVHAFALTCAWVPNKEPLLFCAVPSKPPGAAYPDDWLLGNVSLSDGAWIIDSTKNTAYFIGNLADENGAAIDAKNLAVDESGSYALFTNKADLTLWSLNISAVVSRAETK